MAPPLAAVVRLATVSRALVLALSLLARLLFRPYDTSASLHPPCLSSPSAPSSFNSTAAAISPLAVWDGVHFARSAECGYEYEHSFAFLPLLPASMALLSRTLFAPLVPVLGYRDVLVISGHILNNVAFVAAAAYFYRLSVLILKDSGAAYRASVLFCFNPASVFYSSLYSESLYALFSLGGLFYMLSGANNIAMIMLALSGSARSNGALNAGYFCFQALLQAYDAAIQKKRPILAVQALITGFLRSTSIFLPFFAFQAYGYFNICLHGNTDELRPWCKAKLPLLYSFIQSHYCVCYIHAHFQKIIKKGPLRSRNFNWNVIPTPQCDLSNIDGPFTEEEVKTAVDNTASDKAPGPDGFTGAFFKACWSTIKDDILAVVNQFASLQSNNLHWLKSANIALIPKKEGAEDVIDFRPISLIHAISKLISKMIAACLAPHMNKLVSNAQSAFIKKRSIHDNFLYVRNLARKLHKSRSPTLLFKLNIKKAFDSVRWDYLMDMLRHLGFPSKFRDWILVLLRTATSRVLLNGVAGDPIKHGR